MKRIVTVLAAALVMTAMILVMAMPAFAATPACRDAQKNDNWTCQGNKLSNPGGKSFGKYAGR